jgi:hypothetical protein
MSWYKDDGLQVLAGILIVVLGFAWVVPKCNDDARARERSCIENGGQYVERICVRCAVAK